MNWFAIRVSYSRELALKAILDAEKIENFIPMRYEYVIKSGKRVRRLLPAIHNLVFVHSTRKRIDALKDELESSMPIRFIMNREFCRPVVIPDAQMRSFILVAGSYSLCGTCRITFGKRAKSTYYGWCIRGGNR